MKITAGLWCLCGILTKVWSRSARSSLSMPYSSVVPVYFCCYQGPRLRPDTPYSTPRILNGYPSDQWKRGLSLSMPYSSVVPVYFCCYKARGCVPILLTRRPRSAKILQTTVQKESLRDFYCFAFRLTFFERKLSKNMAK
jgi:hypothetical protein